MAIVRYKRSEIPPMSEERKAELRALAERPDSEIDCSDIPELTEEFWQNAMTAEEAKAVRMRHYEEQKSLQNLFGDELSNWLLQNGRHYQNQLRELVHQFALQHR